MQERRKIELSQIIELTKFIKSAGLDKDQRISALLNCIVADNSDIEPSNLFRRFYDTASEKLVPKSIPELVLQIGDWQYRSYFAVDQEINQMAFLTSIMTNPAIEWK